MLPKQRNKETKKQRNKESFGLLAFLFWGPLLPFCLLHPGPPNKIKTKIAFYSGLSNRQKKTVFFPRDPQKTEAPQKLATPKKEDERPTPEAQMRA
jgi:hypothetical protein